MASSTSEEPLISFDIDGHRITANSSNDHDFWWAYGDNFAECRLGSLKDALVARAKKSSTYIDGDHTYLASNQRPILATLTIKNPNQLAWDEYGFIILDLTDSSTVPVNFPVTTALACESNDIIDSVIEVLQRHDAELVEINPIDSDAGRLDPTLSREWEVWTHLDSNLVNVGDMYRLHRELGYAAFYVKNQLSTARQVLELIRAGGVSSLLGMQESAFLEAKVSAYDKKKNGDLWKFELAADVAGFANSENGGIIIVGIQTKKIQGSDVLVKMHPVPPDKGRARRYHDVLRARLHPLVDGLIIESMFFDKGDMVCIYIPPQREELKPFVVDGGMVKGRYTGNTISIVRRRGEDTVPLGARDIHTMLVAGRAFLRLGSYSSRQIPPNGLGE